MILKKYVLFTILISVLFVFSCGKYQKIVKSTDSKKKLEAATEYYNKKDYFRAYPLFEELLIMLRGTRDAEKVYYYYAFCLYGMEDYYSAAHHFEQFASTYPNSQYAEEALFMVGYCYYADSPGYELDQSNTYRAIRQIQFFVNRFPESKKLKECNEMLDKLRAKLETKSFENAKIYYDTEDYKAAAMAFESVIKDFPDTKYREECLFLTLRCHYLYAQKSVDTKKAERYGAAIVSYKKLAEAFPSGKRIGEAKNLYEDSLRQIEKVKAVNLQPQ